VDVPEPAKLTEEARRPMTAALVAGLSDPDGKVRASSARALAWIGPRAHAAVPELVRRLDDTDRSARENALTAIGQIGPLAKDAIPQLQRLLLSGDTRDRINAATALRLVEADPDSMRAASRCLWHS